MVLEVSRDQSPVLVDDELRDALAAGITGEDVKDKCHAVRFGRTRLWCLSVAQGTPCNLTHVLGTYQSVDLRVHDCVHLIARYRANRSGDIEREWLKESPRFRRCA